MNRYAAIFCVPTRVVDQWRRDTKPEQLQSAMQEMMGAMKKWMSANAANVAEGPNSLGKNRRVTAKGGVEARNEMMGYLIVQAESPDAAARLLQNHPHLEMIPESYVELMEITRQPGA